MASSDGADRALSRGLGGGELAPEQDRMESTLVRGRRAGDARDSDVDAGGPAAGERPLEGWPQLFGPLDVLSVGPERHGDLVVAGRQEVRGHQAVRTVDLALTVALRSPA